MTEEQRKVRQFFEKFVGKSVNYTLSMFGVGMCVFFFLLFCMFPIQALLKDDFRAMLFLGAVVGPLAGQLRIQPYSVYAVEQKSIPIMEFLKYHPIDPKEVKKMRMFYMVRFMGKLLPFCMLAQIPITIWDGYTLGWINVAYIFLVAFVYPVGLNVLSIYFEK